MSGRGGRAFFFISDRKSLADWKALFSGGGTGVGSGTSAKLGLRWTGFGPHQGHSGICLVVGVPDRLSVGKDECEGFGVGVRVVWCVCVFVCLCECVSCCRLLISLSSLEHRYMILSKVFVCCCRL